MEREEGQLHVTFNGFDKKIETNIPLARQK